MATESSLAIDPGGKSRVGASFVGLHSTSTLYVCGVSTLHKLNICRQSQYQRPSPPGIVAVLGNLKNNSWFNRELLAGVDTMSYPTERPATPAVPSAPLQESHPSILSASSGPESDPISSMSEYTCCRLPPVPEPSTLAKAIPQLDLNNSATLEE